MPRQTLSEQLQSVQAALAEANLQRSGLAAKCEELKVSNQLCQDELIHLRPLTAQVADLEKKLKDKTSSSDMWYKKSTDLEVEREQLHMILDAVEGAPERYSKPEPDSYSKHGTERNITTRLAGTFLALSKAFAKVGGQQS